MDLNQSNNIFFEQLYNSLDSVDSNNSIEDDICLISFEKLKEPIITLDCGHKFNYGPIYNDVYNQKNKFNSMEVLLSVVPKDKIKCPYCRNINNKLLPYFKNLGFEKKTDVNWIACKLPNSYYTKPHLYSECCGGEKYSDDLFIPCNQYGKKIKEKKYNTTEYYCGLHKKDFKDAFNIELKKHTSKLYKNKSSITGCIPCDNSSEYKCEHMLMKGKNTGNKCSKKIYSDNLCKQHFMKLSH
jgi:hypothetical protein